MTAKIEPIADHINWNAHAALHDALAEIPIDTPVMVLWLEGGLLKARSSATRSQEAWLMLLRQRHLTDPTGG